MSPAVGPSLTAERSPISLESEIGLRSPIGPLNDDVNISWMDSVVCPSPTEPIVVPALRDVQRAFRLSILHGAHDNALAYMVASDMPLDRLRVHRGAYVDRLTKALRLSYPAIQKLVGVAFFESAVTQFCEDHPPASACLDDYGGAFEAFLRYFRPAASLPYLPDVARLEWAFNRALRAPNASSLDLNQLMLLDKGEHKRLRLIPHPSVSLIHCDYPADTVWRAVLAQDDDAFVQVDLEAGPVWLIVCRNGDQAQVLRLTKQAWHFAIDLFAGKPLQAVLNAHTEHYEPWFLASHLGTGRVIAFELSDPDN